jgi:CheY-like chemotaxis protein
MYHQVEATRDGDRDGPTVLIVEDENVSRRALASLLNVSGYQPQPCESAEQALQEVDRGSRADFALIDIDLPGMDGLELVSRLERLRPDLIPILMTAYEGDRLQRFCRDHPVYYLRKPLDFPHLLSLLGNGDRPRAMAC